MENGITLKPGRGEGTEGSPAERGVPGWGDPKAREAQRLLSRQAGTPRAPQGERRGANAIWAVRGRERRAPSGRILLAAALGAAPAPPAERADVPAAAFSSRCPWPWRSRLTESLPDDSPGNWWQSSSGCGGTGMGAPRRHRSLSPALPGAAGDGPDTNPKRQSQRLPGKLLPVSIGNSEKSPSFPKLAASLHVSFTAGAFSSRI